MKINKLSTKENDLLSEYVHLSVDEQRKVLYYIEQFPIGVRDSFPFVALFISLKRVIRERNKDDTLS